MKRFRRRFIQFNMLFVSFIICVIFVALSAGAWHSQYSELQHTMHQVLQPVGMQMLPDKKPARGAAARSAGPSISLKGTLWTFNICCFFNKSVIQRAL